MKSKQVKARGGNENGNLLDELQRIEQNSPPSHPWPTRLRTCAGRTLNFKWARGGQDFKWHHDINAWPHTNYTPVTMGLYLEDCELEQGPLIVIKGSHERPLYSMYDDNGRWVLSIPEEKLAWAGPKTARLPHRAAGTLVILNCRTVHGSARNDSPRGRPFLLNVYSSADSFAYRANPLANRYEGVIVRGKRAR